MHTHYMYVLLSQVLSPSPVTPLGMNGVDGEMDGWMDNRMDGCNRAGGRRACIRLLPAH